MDMSPAQRADRRTSPDYKPAPASLAAWPDSDFARCDVPGCQGWMLRHLPVCRDHAACVPDSWMHLCHEFVELHASAKFLEYESRIRRHAIKCAEIIG